MHAFTFRFSFLGLLMIIQSVVTAELYNNQISNLQLEVVLVVWFQFDQEAKDLKHLHTRHNTEKYRFTAIGSMPTVQQSSGDNK